MSEFAKFDRRSSTAVAGIGSYLSFNIEALPTSSAYAARIGWLWDEPSTAEGRLQFSTSHDNDIRTNMEISRLGSIKN